MVIPILLYIVLIYILFPNRFSADYDIVIINNESFKPINALILVYSYIKKVTHENNH